MPSDKLIRSVNKKHRELFPKNGNSPKQSSGEQNTKVKITTSMDSNVATQDVFFSPIPKLIHRVWMVFNATQPKIPEKYTEADKILKALHPEYKFVEWNDAKVLNFVHKYYPKFYNKFISYEEPIMRHDVSRYLILKHYGGIFIQHSFVFQKNISPLLGDYELLFSTKLDHIKLNLPHRAGELNNNFMASVPQHPFWDLLISNLQNASYNENSNKNKVMSITGPYILTDTLKEYQSQNNDTSINVLHYKYLMPFYALEKDNPSIKANCIDTKNITQCFTIFPEAFSYTTWEGSWTKKDSKNMALVNLTLLDTWSEKPLYDKLFIMNLKRSPDRWAEIAYAFFKEDIKFERFQAVDGYKVKITDPETNKTFRGIDVKRKVYDLSLGKYYKITCNNDILPPVEITLKSDQARLMAGNIGVCCTKVLIREEIIKRNYTHTIVLEDDFEFNPKNLIQNINSFISALPAYDIAYLHNYVKNRNELNSVNSFVLSPNADSMWYGDWAHMLSLSGAQKLNLGYSFAGPSDDYSRKLALKQITKPGVNDFKVYFAKHNFSMHNDWYYTGQNPKSISTTMGCRDYHPSNPEDCNPNQTMLDQTYVINLDSKKTRLLSISNDLKKHNIAFTEFPATYGHDILITNTKSNQTPTGLDIKNQKIQLNKNEQYKIICNPENFVTTNFIFTGYLTDKNTPVNSGDLSLWCSTIRIFEHALRNNYNRILLLDKDITLKDNFNKALNDFSLNLPKTFDLAYLDFKLFTGPKSLNVINPFVNSFSPQASGSRAHAILFSAKGIEKILSLKNTGVYKYPIDHFYFCLNTGKMNVFKQHPNSECDAYKGFLEAYSSSSPLVTLNTYKLFVINLVDYQDFPSSKQRWEKISAKLEKLNIPYERFHAVNGYKTIISDPNNNTWTGRDIKNKNVLMKKDVPYKILCDNGVNEPITITLSSSDCTLMAGNIGTLCSKALVRKEIIKQELKYAVILEDDFEPTEKDFKTEINKLITSSPPFDLIYLDCLFSKGGVTKFNNVLSSFNDNARWHGNWALLMSYSGAVKLDSGDTYEGCSSDRYAVKMHKGIIKKPGIDSFHSFYANFNFSSKSVDSYSGHNSNSIATQMGCRDYHPSNTLDCDFTKIVGIAE